MYIKLLLISFLILFTACNDDKPHKQLDGKKLLETKCASCHDINMPPITSKDELAPPMMAVAFHVANFMKPSDESQRIPQAVAFVVDYAQEPALEKSFCDEDSLKRYGLMPSQKDNASAAEIKAIAEYMFFQFTQDKLSKVQAAQNKYNALPAGEKLALKYKCMGCHKIDRKIIGPSLKNIAKKFQNSQEDMIQSIQNGSKEKWESSNGAVMPPFKKIDEKDLKVLTTWILAS